MKKSEPTSLNQFFRPYKDWPKFIFILISMIGIVVALYLIYNILNPHDKWSIEMSGVDFISQNEISEALFYFIRSNHGKINRDEIKEVLSLNPRIKAVRKVKITSEKKIFLDLELRKTAYISHDLDHNYLRQVSRDEKVMEENIGEFKNISSKIPILCLTKGSNLGDASKSHSRLLTMKRDIISTFLLTENDYSFLWNRISEICLDPSGYYEIYSTKIKSQIKTNEKFSKYLLSKLWAIFSYLEQTTNEEKNKKNHWTMVTLGQRNAQINRLSPTQ